MALYKYRKILTSFSLALCLLAGCQGPQYKDPYAAVIQTPQRVRGEILGYSLQHRPIELLTAGDGEEVILVIATIHGNEDAGTPLVYKLVNVLKQRPALLESRTVLIVPVANPDGMALRTRSNAAGIDLNRNFPAMNRINNQQHGIEGLSEPESQILHDLILSRKPVRIASLHQPLVCLDYDGPAEPIARFMNMYCSLPVKKLGGRPGSLGSFCGIDQNTPIVTVEFKKSDSQLTADELWARYGPAMLAFITYPNLPY